MAIPLSERKKARDAATYHVQVELLDVPGGFAQPYGNLGVQGRVVRIFKGDSRLKIGDRVEFSVAIVVDPECLLDGGLTLPYDELLRARYLEVCLNGVPPRCNTVIDLHDIVPEPTDSPQIAVDTER